MKITLKLDGSAKAGGTPLIVHGERLADPLDPFARAIREISKKRNKTDADHEQVAQVEWTGCLYTDPPIPSPADVNGQVVGIPAWNIIRCLQDGAKRHKRGADVLRGIHPIQQFAPITFVGGAGKTVQDLWAGGEHYIRKTVGVQRARTIRTRPMFTDWAAQLDVEVDPTVFDIDQLAVIWREAGVYAGLCEMRPIYGRFAGTVVA